ncbi:MAG: hypothetical protein Q9174_002872 [Haloplaca sp. 1 TL-2023]
MPPSSSTLGLTITNPLISYRALLATKKIEPDPAQHRLALHLQKLYHRLKDYEPNVDYKYQIDRLKHIVGKPPPTDQVGESHGKPTASGRRRGLLSSFLEEKAKVEALALTRKLTDHESAVKLQSPQGLLLYGEVGTGKSMLIDLLAECLPNRKKRRWHFNTFMLETLAKLEHLRKSRLTESSILEQEPSLLWLARDMISTSPILFLDEFQLPDRASSKILSNLFTSFFQLGGVLIATSNRMPEELANASGVEFSAPPLSTLGMFRNRWGFSQSSDRAGRSEGIFAGKGDFAAFLEVLRARCEIWDMEAGKDWRRRELEEEISDASVTSDHAGAESGFQGLHPMVTGNWGLGYEQSTSTSTQNTASPSKGGQRLPRHYYVSDADPDSNRVRLVWESAVGRAIPKHTDTGSTSTSVRWQTKSLQVYGRNLLITRHLSGVTYWTFNELCATNLGPADYITLASNFHTFILASVPVLTLLQKNEARRFITLLDALYEARCKLLIQGAAGPDDILFPEANRRSSTAPANSTENSENGDGVYPETFSEIYQDQTSPFRPNVSAYTSSASPPSYDASPLPSTSSSSSRTARSMLADEDSDFGPTYGGTRSSISRYQGAGDGVPGAGNEIGNQRSPNFAQTGIFTGEDERFAYKRARSRLWEMCGARWWERQEEGWWRPLEKEVRRWEGTGTDSLALNQGTARQRDASSDVDSREVADTTAHSFFRHDASPFRTSQEPPPKIPWTHAWGMMKWGKKAGAWGQGPEGLKQRSKQDSDADAIEQEARKTSKR